jgi:hypothetical protein
VETTSNTQVHRACTEVRGRRPVKNSSDGDRGGGAGRWKTRPVFDFSVHRSLPRFFHVHLPNLCSCIGACIVPMASNLSPPRGIFFCGGKRVSLKLNRVTISIQSTYNFLGKC